MLEFKMDIAERIADKNYYICKSCNILLRKKNRWRHNNTKHHEHIEEIVRIRGKKEPITIEHALRLIKGFKQS